MRCAGGFQRLTFRFWWLLRRRGRFQALVLVILRVQIFVEGTCMRMRRGTGTGCIRIYGGVIEVSTLTLVYKMMGDGMS